MSFRNIIMATACGTFLVLTAWGEEAAKSPPSAPQAEAAKSAPLPPKEAAVNPTPSPPPNPESATICRHSDLNGVPPPANVDCTPYQGQLELQAKRMEYLVKIQGAQEQIAESKKKATETGPPGPPGKPHAPVAQPPEADRVIEVFGDQARIRYQGGDFLVRQGQKLPHGEWIDRVSLEGVVVTDGRNRRALPFYIGAHL